jgi:hypothetical protein
MANKLLFLTKKGCFLFFLFRGLSFYGAGCTGISSVPGKDNPDIAGAL